MTPEAQKALERFAEILARDYWGYISAHWFGYAANKPDVDEHGYEGTSAALRKAWEEAHE